MWDADGRSYLDLMSGTWCNVLGHGHPGLTAAVRDQASRWVHAGAAYIGAEVEEALARVSEVLPPELSRAVFLNTGSEAVELALKMARAATGAHRVVVGEDGYYGATGCALGLSAAGRRVDYLPPAGAVARLPTPDCKRCPMGVTWPCREYPCLDPLSELAERDDGDTAAVVCEPVMAGAGVVVPPPGYAARLRALTSRCGALLIAEEVTTGVGRTGRWFGFEHDDVVPDILVLGKGLGAGFPVAAVVTTADVEAGCQGVLTHIQSHQNDPFSGRIAATVVSILRGEGLVDRVAERGRYLLDGLKAIGSRHACIAEVRGRGFMIGVRLHEDAAGRGPILAGRLLESGFIADYQGRSSAFRLFPPYTLSIDEIDSFLKAFDQVLSAGQR